MKAFSFFPAMALALTLSLSSVQAATDVYVVSDVPSGDFLNMRTGAGVSNAITGRIPSNGQGVVTTGEEKKVGSTVWAKVYWNGVGGWVSKRYLLPANQASKAPAAVVPPVKAPTTNVLVCTGTEPFWRIDVSDATLKVNMSDGPQYTVPVTFRQTSANNTTIAVIGGATGTNNTQAFMQKVDSCSDGMSEVKYPYSITAVLNNKQVVSGCCKVQ
ncbi:hypothetical protein J9253_06440 [Thiothrix litoralis]|jgi:uncharacterized membrane protein|uniref:SH3b domain-containing protein n=1 Tax=Thiothrix litoralis TaxID=2891210 RepID=A0ABX7WYX0_9GAMM|nr:SH3 domain-containing protein [Thiothrix litoralis]QTR47568.1 hypothetical protein J9253_06440 [Thiothrix litoralis]